MRVETLKLGLIERLMRVQKTSTLKRVEQLIIQAEMETRAEESLRSIEEGDVVSLGEFREENVKWGKRNSTK